MVVGSRKQRDALLLRRLRRQIYHARTTVPFYERSFKKTGADFINIKAITDLSKFPTICKSDIQKSPPEFMCRKASMKLCPRSHTSGSSGQPTWTYYDYMSWLRKKYWIKLRARLACGMRIGDRVAIFECVREAAQPRQLQVFSMKRWIPVRTFSVFSPLEGLAREVMAYDPQVIYGGPGHLFQLARYLELQGVTPAGLRIIFTSSEYLESSVRTYISSVFGVPVYDVYGSTEFKEVAWECPRQEGYHINEDEVMVEVLTEGQPASVGEVGDIVLTDLRNSVMPLIRYSIGDKGMLLDKQCSCGRAFALMKPCAGRASEYITLPDGLRLSPYVFTTSIEHIPGLLHYQIVQTGAKDIEVNVVSSQGHNENLVREIAAVLTAATGKVMNIKVNSCDKIASEHNGKYKVVRNLYEKQADR